MTRRKKIKIMKNFYRIDVWYKDGSGSNFYFESTLSAAKTFVKGMKKISVDQTSGIEHTSITPFRAKTCNIYGWINGEIGTPTNYA